MTELPVPKPNVSQSQPTQSSKTKNQTKKRSLTREEVFMRRMTLYFVIGLCAFSEIASVFAFFLTASIQATAILQIPTILCLYRILCYLFPLEEATHHPFMALLRVIFPHKP
jgi:hypothetical protein